MVTLNCHPGEIPYGVSAVYAPGHGGRSPDSRSDPLLVTVTRPLGLFATTALVFLVVMFWVGTWLALEVVCEWRAR